MSDLVFLVALGAAIYTGAPKWALIIGSAILIGVHMILAALVEGGREADRQIADIRSQLRELRDPSKPRSAYDDY